MFGLNRLAVLSIALLPWGLAAPMLESAGLMDVAEDFQIEGNYIITLKPGLTSRDLHSHIGWVSGVHARSLSAAAFSGVRNTYSINTFHGYYGHFDADTVEAIRSNPEVADVEPDQIWQANALSTQSGAPWGLAAISHRASGSDSYVYDADAGLGTFAYVVDSGINKDHVEFTGRVELGHNQVGGQFIDQVGHGTHVAGTIGGTTYGVSKKVTIVSVKIFKNSMRTTTSAALGGFNWTVGDIIKKGREAKSVVNLSVGGGKSTAFNTAVESAFEAGIVTVVAAGNDNRDVSRYSPASAPSAITVGAIDSQWRVASYSNYGDLLDIFAPGSSITSAWIGSATAKQTLSGTSMACPHIAGLVSYFQSVEGLTTPQAVTERLKGLATTGKIRSLRTGSPNLIGYNGNV